MLGPGDVVVWANLCGGESQAQSSVDKQCAVGLCQLLTCISSKFVPEPALGCCRWESVTSLQLASHSLLATGAIRRPSSWLLKTPAVPSGTTLGTCHLDTEVSGPPVEESLSHAKV